MLEARRVASAMLVLTMFVAYSRPTETLRLQKKDLVLSTSLGSTCTLVLNRDEDFETSKMGVADENLSIDSKAVPWLGKALAMLGKNLIPTQKLFQVEYNSFLEDWKNALHTRNLPKRHSNPLPAAPRRRQLGPLQKIQDTARSKDERSMAIRQLHEQIQEEGFGVDGLRLSPSAGAKALQRSSADAAQQCPQHFGLVKEFHGYALELFAGSARLSRALSRLNCHVEAWDINCSPACGLSKVSIVNTLVGRIKSGAMKYICSFWFALQYMVTSSQK